MEFFNNFLYIIIYISESKNFYSDIDKSPNKRKYQYLHIILISLDKNKNLTTLEKSFKYLEQMALEKNFSQEDKRYFDEILLKFIAIF